jgi:tetratricopeptide (TPR) repeat protein
VAAAKRAFDLRDRVSEHERFYIDDHYYTATGNIEKERENLELFIRAYPNDSSAPCNLALVYILYLGQYEKAIPLANDCLRLEPNASFGYTHAGGAYLALNRLEEARTVLQRAFDAKADNVFVHRALYEVAFVGGDAEGMQREMKWAEGKPIEYLLLNEAAAAAALRGKIQIAREMRQRSVQLAARLGFKDSTAGTLSDWAWTEAEAGNALKAREFATSSSVLARGRNNLTGVAGALALTGNISRAQSIIQDLGRRFPEDTILHDVGLPAISALAALNRKAPDQAIEALKPAVPYEMSVLGGMFPNYLRGLAHLQARRGANAAAEFQKLVDHPGVAPMAFEHALARLWLGRACVAAGDSAKAKAAYQDFLALWKDADPDVPILKEAKAEYAKLQ